MTAKILASADGTYGSLGVGATEAFRFGSDNSGQLAGFRNILINGDMRINQRGVTIAAAANGAYGPDRWKKVDASNMTQIVEAGNFVPNATYTLSGTNVITQQIVAPASGDWTMPNIPITATNVQCELGSIATSFEQRPYGLELSLCQRYYEVQATPDFYSGSMVQGGSYTVTSTFKVAKRATPNVNCIDFSNNGFNAGNPSPSNISVDGFTAAKTGATTNGGGSFSYTWNASAEL